MALLFRNNAESTLASTASAVATTVTVVDGSVFPSPGSDTFLVTLTQGSGPETSWEIALCTARSGNDLTVTRAQEGTTAVEWPAGTKVSMRLTAGALGTAATMDGPAGAIVGTTDTQTLTNKSIVFGSIADTGELKIRGGTTAQHATFTGAEREVTVDTTKDTLVVHDGTTAGGFPLLKEAAVGTSVQAFSSNLTAFAGKTAPSGAVVGTTDTQTLTNKTVSGLTSTGFVRETPVTGNAGTAYTINLANGTVFDLTLDQSNVDFTFPTATAGRQFTLLVTLGGAGRTYTFPASVRWDADGAPDISTVSGRTDRLVFQADGTYWLASVAGIGFDRS